VHAVVHEGACSCSSISSPVINGLRLDIGIEPNTLKSSPVLGHFTLNRMNLKNMKTEPN